MIRIIKLKSRLAMQHPSVIFILLLGLSFLFALLLSGCNGQGVSSAERIIGSGWADVSNEDVDGQEPIYCYKTLGGSECYKTPDDKRRRELVATYPTAKTAKPVGIGKVFAAFSDDGQKDGKLGEETLEAAEYRPQVKEEK